MTESEENNLNTPEGGSNADGAPKKRRRRRRRGKGEKSSQAPENVATETSSPASEEAEIDSDDLNFDLPSEPDPAGTFSREKTFADLGLRDSVLKGVRAAGFKYPTEIQAQMIKFVTQGVDVLGQARTGTGKTAAFALPLLHMAKKDKPVQALILVPTRELAIQVHSAFEIFGQFTPIHSIPIYGGQSIPKQVDGLKKNPQIAIGTPGRVMDLHNRGILSYDNIDVVVLDEVDRMLDIGFRDDIKRILGDIPGDPQTVFVSATIQPEIEDLAAKYLKNPKKFEVSAGSLTVQQVEQRYFSVMRWDKMRLLHHLLTHEDPDLTLVFCQTKVMVDRLARYLRDKGVVSQAIHGDMPQRKRNSVMEKMREGKFNVVVASDLAARGLDVSDISHVVNYDLPEDPEIYIHRIGRTARAGRRGTAWSFVSPDDGKLLTNIEKLANICILETDYPDFKPGPVPEKIRREQMAAQERRDELESKVKRSGPDPVWEEEESEVDLEKFPDGIVPTKPPKRTLGGRMRTRRGR